MENIVVLTGAGISAESGLKTFRDSGGLWENYNIEDVATPDAWKRNPELVLRFYNERRKEAFDARPNAGHTALVELEKHYEVTIITQNVDNLHEKAGSKNVVHLHGEISKVRSEKNEKLIKEIGSKSIHLGDVGSDKAQLRPHIVWFGEAVPMIDLAIELCKSASIFIVIGTSMQVYPAAGLLDYVPNASPKYFIDPIATSIPTKNCKCINETATVGVPLLINKLIKEKFDV